MRIGINAVWDGFEPEQWADTVIKMGFTASSFPVDYKEPVSRIDAFVKAAKDRDILIAEVGAWCSPFLKDEKAAQAGRERCFEQLRLADYVKANCCVNVSGAVGDIWFGCYAENYAEELYKRNVEFIQELCDKVKPQHTYYTLEPMQWMYPDTPECYAKMLKDVNRERFAVHQDPLNFVKDPYTYSHQEELFHKCFDLLGPYTKACHLKDCYMAPGQSVDIREVVLGEGVSPIRVYLDEVEKLDPDMPIMLEHLPDLSTYAKARANLERFL